VLRDIGGGFLLIRKECVMKVFPIFVLVPPNGYDLMTAELRRSVGVYHCLTELLIDLSLLVGGMELLQYSVAMTRKLYYEYMYLTISKYVIEGYIFKFVVIGIF